MARQQSNTELAGSMAATLTPSVRDVSVAQTSRGSENSGLFDVGALYAEALGEVMQRTRTDPRLMPLARAQPAWPTVARATQPAWPTVARATQPASPPLARAAQPAWPLATRWPEPVLSFDLDEDPIEFMEISVARRSQGLGWFGVAVAWLATVTTGALIAIGLPAHAPTHARSAAVSAAVIVVPAAPLAASPPVVLSAAAPPVVAAALVATQLPAAPVVPVVSVAQLAIASPLVTTRKVAPKAEAPAVARARPAPVATAAAPAVAPVNAPATAPVVAAAPHAPPPAKVAAPAAAPAAPVKVSTAGMSLDELIRHEVQVESAKKR